MSDLFDPVSAGEAGYARALRILVGPTSRAALALRVVSLVYWACMIVALGWLGSQVLDRGDPVTILTMIAEPNIVRAGEPVRVHTALHRFKSCDVRLDWSVQDSRGEIFRFAPRFGHAPGPEDYTVTYDTSRGMAPGPARLHVTMQAQCPGNYLQALAPLVMELPDVRFDVAPDAAPP